MRVGRRVTIAVGLMALAALVIVVAGCNTKSAGTSGADSQLEGSILADGSSTLFPITEAMAEEFRNENPNVKVTVGVSGTGGGFEKFCNGETDISNASRAIKDEELAKCKENNIEPIELQIGHDGIAMVANPGNEFVTCLTTDELKRIWEPNSKVESWKDVRREFPAQEIKLYGPGTDSGTFDFFTKEINGEEKASRSDYTASEDDNVLVQGVQGDKGSLGYFGVAYYEENKDKLKIVEVDGGKGCQSPTAETVISGEYTPLARPLFIYVKKSALGRDEVAKFAEFYVDQAKVLVPSVGYVAATGETLGETMATLQSAIKE